MNIHVGDDDVGVEKSPKNEKPQLKWEVTERSREES